MRLDAIITEVQDQRKEIISHQRQVDGRSEIENIDRNLNKKQREQGEI